MEGTLELEDGTIYHGRVHGAHHPVSGEVVFQTGMVGYTESLTDPSYHGQILVLTYPMVGNYGVPGDELDEYGLHKWLESRKVWPVGVVVSELCEEHSHWNAKRSLSKWLEEQGILIIEGIDTRSLTMKLRECGTVLGKVVTGDNIVGLTPFSYAGERNLLAEVSIKVPSPVYNLSGSPRILVIDCGLKYNQLRCLLSRGACVQVVPWDHEIHEEMAHFDGLFLTNGPGNPQLATTLIENLASYMQSADSKPIFGICMGHQIIALAARLETFRMKYGNRGHNQPCVHHPSGRCYITSQNHGFAVDARTLPAPWTALFTNANDQTNEGLVHLDKAIFSVQFHPEHMAGPTDTEWLFDVFLDSVKRTLLGDCPPLAELINAKVQAAVAPCPVFAFKPRKVLILGSGGLTIGQAGEFDYCGAQAIKALKDEGVHTVLINPNVATSQTTKGLADTVYFLPVNVDYVTQVIKAERPDGILLNFGGQTALNCGVKLVEEGVLDRYNVKVLGTPVQVIIWTEDRQLFAEKLAEIGYRVAPSAVAYSVDDALAAAKKLGYPLLIRAAYSLGGLNSGFAENRDQLIDIASKALVASTQLFIDKSLKGWKELEYEVVRDVFDNCITVCNMENIDPLGIHTGDSIVVAPSQTLSNAEFHMLRTAAIRVIRHLGVVGECNIQYALDPNSQEFYVVEVNARLSRSSALASKATGFPLAFIAAKLAMGHSLVDLRNPVTGVTTACFEPSLDYCVVKIPRWDLNKFPGVSRKVGSAMKSIGEGMAVGRSFEEAFQKALRMVNEDYLGFDPYVAELSEEELRNASDKRILVLATALAEGYTVERLHNLTKIDRWFLAKMKKIHDFRMHLTSKSGPNSCRRVTYNLMLAAKKLGFADRQIALCVHTTKQTIRAHRCELKIHPWVRQIDTVAGEWPACANYLYTTFHSQQHDVMFSSESKSARPAVMVLGSGVYRIGSSVEFDCCAVGCLAELRRLGRRTIMINCNPETVSTDYDVCDRLYFEDISIENVMDIYELENPEGVILSMGGQLPNNIAMWLHRLGAVVLGTSPESIDSAENRFKFSRLLDTVGILQPKWEELTSLDAARDFCQQVQYPCLIRPSYVLSGAAMQIAYSARDLEMYLGRDAEISRDCPVVISKFVENAREIDVDAVAANGTVVCMAISEHVEYAGVHSGDATLITPPQDLDAETMGRIREVTMVVAEVLEANGPLNLQLLLKNDVLQVIECNLRVSRSFPFVSKTLDYDFVVTATRVALGEKVEPFDLLYGAGQRVGVKAPMFSFARLPQADVSLGVEMRSTGEVAGYGRDKYEALLKAMISAGFKYPKPGGKIFLGISSISHREELTATVVTLGLLGFKLYGNPGTAAYYQQIGIVLEEVEWSSNPVEICRDHNFDLAISIPTLKGSTPRLSIDSTMGHQVSRAAADFDIPLITNMSYAKILVEALRRFPQPPPLRLHVDSITSRRFVRLPGLIDIGAIFSSTEESSKDDFSTMTSAALAGGFTTICGATRSAQPQQEAPCDYGFILAASSMDNAKSVAGQAGQYVALKLCQNEKIFGSAALDDMANWEQHFRHWPKNRPVCVQSDSKTLAAILLFAHLHDRSVHVCQVSTREQIFLIREAKRKGMKVTCEVAVHCLFLTEKDLKTSTKTSQLETADDQKVLWDNMGLIDCFAAGPNAALMEFLETDCLDHFPGVGTALPLLLTAVREGRLSLDDVTTRLYDNPRRIFSLPEQKDTFVEVDLDTEWVLTEDTPFLGNANWSAFMDRQVHGKVHRVVIRGEDAYIDGQIIAEPRTGRYIERRSQTSDRLSVWSSKSAENINRPNDGSGDSNDRPPLVTSRSMNLSPAAQLESDAEELDPIPTKFDRAMHGRLDGMRAEKGARRLSFDVAKTKEDMDTIFRSTSASLTSSRSLNELRMNHAVRRPSIPLVPAQVARLPFRHIVSAEDFEEQHLDYLFGLAKYFQAGARKGRSAGALLSGRVLALLFYQSDKTSINSYAAAMQRLGGSVIYMDPETSSVQKGESLRDTVTIMASYSDAIVLKQSAADPIEAATWTGLKPLINAGDGTGEDVTQALSDAFTIWDELGALNGLTVTFIGNLHKGSAIHSLIKLLALYPLLVMRFIDTAGRSLPEDLQMYLQLRGIQTAVYDSIQVALPDTNILYIGSLDRDDFANPLAYEDAVRRFGVSPHVMMLGRTEKRLGPRLRVLHPLPRSDLLSPEMDGDPRVAHFRQAENGLYLRMALLASLIKSPSVDNQGAVPAEVSIQTFRRRRSSMAPTSTGSGYNQLA